MFDDVIYFCLLLVGLSGTVRESFPCSTSGLRCLLTNPFESLNPSSAAISCFDFSVLQNSNILSCRLSTGCSTGCLTGGSTGCSISSENLNDTTRKCSEMSKTDLSYAQYQCFEIKIFFI